MGERSPLGSWGQLHQKMSQAQATNFHAPVASYLLIAPLILVPRELAPQLIETISCCKT